jgi:hypothetical protein
MVMVTDRHSYAYDLMHRLLKQAREENRVMRLDNQKLMLESADFISHLYSQLEEHHRKSSISDWMNNL